MASRGVDSLGGRYSTQLGIDLDRADDEIERWALAATLFGARISAKIAEHTFGALEQAGVHSIAEAGRRDIGGLIELIDAAARRVTTCPLPSGCTRSRTSWTRSTADE